MIPRTLLVRDTSYPLLYQPHQQAAHLRIKCRVLDVAAQEQPQVVLHHERLDIGMLVLLVDFFSQRPAVGSHKQLSAT